MAALCIGAIWFGAFRGDGWTWGVHSLAFVPAPVRFACLGALLLVLLGPVARPIGKAVGSFGNRMVPSPLFGALTTALAGILYYVVRPEIQFLGDDAIWQAKLARGQDITHYDAAAVAVISHISRWISPGAPQHAAGIPAVFLGALYAVTVWVIARRMAAPLARGAAWMLLFWSPALLLFCGYVAGNSFAYAAEAILLALLLTGRGGVLALVAVTGVGIALHLSSLTWLPAIAAMLWMTSGPSLWRRSLRTLAVCVGALGVASLIILATGHTPSALVETLLGDPALRANSQAWILSRRHAVDTANELVLLTAPAMILVSALPIRLVWRGFTPRWRAVAWLIPAQVLMLLVVQPLLGGARDWDLFVGLGLPVLACAACALDVVLRPGAKEPSEAVTAKQSNSQRAKRFASAGRAVAVAIVSTAGYMWVNLDSHRAANRMVAIQSPNGLMTRDARSMANELLAVYYHSRDRAAARDAWRRAAEATPTSVRYLKGWARSERRLGNLDASLAVWRRVAAQSPGDRDAITAIQAAQPDSSR